MIKVIKKFFKLRRERRKKVSSSIFIGKKTSPLDVDLVDDNINEKDKKQLRQFSKTLIIVIMSMCAIWITWSYILATISLIKLFDSQPLEELSKQIILTILGCCIGYFCKSFFETYSEKKNELEYSRMEQDVIISDNDEECAG